MGFDYEMQVITINLSCLADSGGGGGNTGTSGSGTNGSTSSGDSGYSNGSTSSTGSGGSTGSNSNTINTTYVPCTECLDFSPELGDFIYNLNTNQLDFWNNLNIRIQQQIVEFLNQNNYSVEAIEIIIFALTDLMNDECAILPTFLDPTQVSAPYDPDLFGDYPVSTTQQDHDAIQQQFNNLRNTVGNLAAVNYLITTYNMNAFGSNSINFNYTISFENGLSNGADANAIRTFTNGILTSCNLEIDINLFSSVDFGYITRVIKHELLHILQGITYGQYGVSLAAQEFDAYYLQIFGFKELKAISNASIQYQLAKKMITYMKQLTTSEKIRKQKTNR